MKTNVECWRHARPLGLMLAFGVLMALPATAQNQNPMELAAKTARVLRFDRPIRTAIVGDPSIAEVTVEGDRIVVLSAKKVGATNLIVLDTDTKEMLNQSIIVADPFEPPTMGARVTLQGGAEARGLSPNATRGLLQKVLVYRCPVQRLCEIVTEPQPSVTREEGPQSSTESATTTIQVPER
jgi:Flp pilus assembly secretin CpaC